MKERRGDGMPRMARQKSNSKVYHVLLRGNARQDIFLDKQDFCKFIKEIAITKEKYSYELYTYCLMTNHVHLILYDKDDNLSKALQSLAVSYSSYWNKKYERVGHVFQNRFLSKCVETKEYLKNLCRYIHQNPEKSGIAKMQDYQWSSYQEFVKECRLIDNKQILMLFGNGKQDSIPYFIQFHNINIQENTMENLMEYEMIDRLNDEQASQYIIEILGLKNVQDISKCDRDSRNKYLRKLAHVQGISNLQIARLTGLSRKMVDAVINRKKRKEE